MPILESALTILIKEIFKDTVKKKWKAMKREHKVLRVLKKANLAKLENEPKSIYAHALVNYGVDKEPADLVSLFAQDEVKKAIERNPEDLPKALERNLHQNKDLQGLKIFPSVASLMDEVKSFQNIYQTFQKQAADPFMLKMFNNLQEGMMKLVEENEKNSFEYQVEEYLQGRINYFKEKYLEKNLYIDLNGETRVLEETHIKNSSEKGDPYIEFKEGMMKGEIKEKNIQYLPLDKYINTWLKNTSSRLLVIMGEYGTGKTTFTEHITHQLACRNLGLHYSESIKDEINRIPLFLPLRDFEKSMETFVADQCNNKYGITSLNFAEFKKRIDSNELLVILDGFDEMTQRTDADERERNFAKINRLIKESPNSKFILTCREEYFYAEEEMVKLFGSNTDSDIVHLLPFDDDQIKQFLNSHTSFPEKIWEKIKKISGLGDLAKRPVLLDLIVKYLPDLVKEKDKIKASDLYHCCINDELNRVDEKISYAIPGKNRLEILKRLAAWLYVNDTLSFDTRLIGEELQLEREFNTQTKWEYEKRLSEFLTFTFLIREYDYDYQFRVSHKSFRDYLAAIVFIEEINNGNLVHFPKAQATEELRKFMLEHPLNQENLKIFVLNAKNLIEDNQWQGSNAANLLLALDNNALAGENLSECVLREVNFFGNNLKNTSFHSAILTGSSFHEQVLEAESISSADTTDCALNVSLIQIISIERIEAFIGLSELRCSFTQVRDLSPVNDLIRLKTLMCNSCEISDLSPVQGLINLQTLDCSFNKISDLSPVQGLISLQYLDCSFNEINDLSPVQGLINLQYLTCYSTQISDLSPLKGLTNLQRLDCSSNQISDLSPVQGLINLRRLDCSSNQISDLSPVQGLINLQELYCSSTQISDLNPVQGLINLQYLNCSFTQISDLSPVQGLINLQKLYCSSTQINDLSPVQGLINLQKLGCSSIQISDLSPVQGLSNLQELDCSSIQISDLSPVQGLSNLQELDCSSTQISDLSPVQGLSNLQGLDCSSTQISDLSPVQGLSNLQKLDCSSTQITDLSPLKGLSNLQRIIMSKDQFPQNMIDSIQKALPDLTIEFKE